MKITFTARSPAEPDALVVGAFADRVLSAAAGEIDGQTRGALGRAMSASRFTGASEQFVDIVAPAALKAARVVLAGLGKPGTLDELGVQSLGGSLVAHLNDLSLLVVVEWCHLADIRRDADSTSCRRPSRETCRVVGIVALHLRSKRHRSALRPGRLRASPQLRRDRGVPAKSG